MKKLFLLFIFLFLIVPSSVQASGVFDFVSFVIPKSNSNAGFWTSQNDKDKSDIASTSSPINGDVPCEFGFKYNYKELKCEKVLVPEHGVLNEDGISVRCEVGYKSEVEKIQDSRQAGMTVVVECIKVVIPAHAQLAGSGDDFQCDRDFRRVGDLCEKLILPSNAHIAAGGNDFDCNTGFRKDEEKCVDAKKPDNAKFFPQSDDWYCENGHVRNGDKCESLRVPSNGRASETGTFFYCLPGHKLAENGKDCEQVKVPVNAEPNWIGNWDCNQGYKKVVRSRNEWTHDASGMTGECVKVELPANAKYLSRGADFYCDAQYVKNETDRTCVKIVLPANASWDDASQGPWRCNQGYAKKDNSCEVFKIPEHAFWVGFNSWDCDAGYLKKLDNGQGTVGSCEEVSIPEHAHVSQSFEKWDCDNGYTKNYKEKRCEKI